MRTLKLATTVAAAAVLANSAEAQTTPNGWALLAQADVEAIHERIAENHPGPVNAADPAFSAWLEQGRARALEQASSAQSYADYLRSLRLYVNGFHDGHLGLSARLTPTARWPGFRVISDGSVARVAAAEPGVEAPLGAEVVSCDGQPIDALMRTRVDPYFWNSAIPHERFRHLGRLFVVSADPAAELSACVFRTSDGNQTEIPLTWRSLETARMQQALTGEAAAGSIGLRRIGEVWLVSLPTFQLSTEQVAEMNRLVEELKATAPGPDAILVFDVRGNGGGNSVWGDRIARAVWGDASVAHVKGGFDGTLDYRASRANIASVEFNLARARRDNLVNAIVGLETIRDRLTQAVERGEALVSFPAPPRRGDTPPPPSAFLGRAYLLTDGACASACLDFADTMRRLPGVTHIGAATSADTIYMENTGGPLPSGLTNFSYSMKVYRNRIRGGNEWYEPQTPWPAEPPRTDEELAAWVRSLAT